MKMEKEKKKKFFLKLLYYSLRIDAREKIEMRMNFLETDNKINIIDCFIIGKFLKRQRCVNESQLKNYCYENNR